MCVCVHECVCECVCELSGTELPCPLVVSIGFSGGWPALARPQVIRVEETFLLYSS